VLIAGIDGVSAYLDRISRTSKHRHWDFVMMWNWRQTL